MPEDNIPVEGFKETIAEAEKGINQLVASIPFLPILDRVLIRRIEAEATADGFGVPEKYRQHSNVGIVIAVGENVEKMTQRVREGAKVLYGEYTSEQWDAPNGDVYWIVRIQDIRGVVRE